MNYLSGLSLDLGILGGLATDLSYENSKNKLKYQFLYQKSMLKTQIYFTSKISFYHYLDNFQKTMELKEIIHFLYQKTLVTWVIFLFSIKKKYIEKYLKILG